ncbi:MAG: Trm112 family protein [Hydrogenothermaceae bacterium]|nr:Trm112 family protein [Hydrogenothermaceae bacterium]
MIDKEMLDILCCPACKSDLEDRGEYLICKNCKLKYPVEDGIPILLISEAVKDDDKTDS